MEPMVSIIVPVYNAEEYISRCVDSILNQEYKDFELILVDDGSTDCSGQLIDDYAKADNRIVVIHKENGGVSHTRNLAIEHARGTYLQFLDSDDWITPDATKLLVRAAEENQCDLVIADFYRVVGNRLSHKGDIDEDKMMTKEEFAEHMMENPADFYYGVLWNKLYRRDLIETYHLRMDTRISWCEDFMFNLEYLLHTESVYALHAPIYYYLKRKGSLVSQGFGVSQTIKMKLTVFEYYDNFYRHVYDEKDYEKKRLSVYRFLIDAANDNNVLPPIMPHVKKLGNERINVNIDAASKDGIFMDLYRNRKLFERYLEIAAIKNDLTVREAALLFIASQFPEDGSKKDFAEIMGVPQGTITIALQKLSLKGLLKVSDVKNEKTTDKTLKIILLPEAEGILNDLEQAKRDYEDVCYQGFHEEERILYEQLTKKRKENILNILSSAQQ